MNWTKALDAASESKYAEALAWIEKIETISPDALRGGVPLLKGYLLYSMERYEDCVDTIARAMAAIDRDRHRNEHDKRYLKCYALTCSNAAAAKLGRKIEWPEDLRHEAIDLDPVPRHLKQNFPLRDHPRWVEV